MDARPPMQPFTRPPDGSMIHNPNHHQPSPSYPPSSQPQQPQQGQQPLHVPFSTSTDPYATSRRDPFLPPSSHHARQRSHGALEGASQVHGEKNGSWGNTGTQDPWRIPFEGMQRLRVSGTNPRAHVLGAGACLRWQWHSSHGWVVCAATRRREGETYARARRAQRTCIFAAGHVDCGRPGIWSCGLNSVLLHTSPPVASPTPV